MNFKRFLITIIALCIFLISYEGILSAQEKTISIDVSTRYQTIDNFGASDCWSMQKIGAWIPAQKERVADLLFSMDKGIGLSAWRFNIGGGLNHTTIGHPWRTVETFEVSEGVYDWTRQENERWFLQAAKERGVDQFLAFVNSPPGRMTRNGYTNCTNGLGSTNLRTGYEDQFATYLVDILKHFRDEWGITFDFISPVNEPQWEWNPNSNQEGNRASNSDIKAIVTSLDSELQNQNVDTQISIIESGDLKSWYQENSNMAAEYGKTYGNYLSKLIGHDDIKDKIGNHFAGHSYWSDRLSTQLVQDRQDLYVRIQSFLKNGWKYWMTEYCVLDGPEGKGGRGRDLTMQTALDVCRIIHHDLTLLHASAWQWWTAVSPEDYKDGLIYTDYKNNPNSQNIIESKLLWAFGNYSRYIRPGSIRLKLTGADDKYGLMGSAYINSEEDKLIIVFVNMGYANESVSFDFSGLGPNKEIVSFLPSVTSDTSGDDLKPYPAFSTESGYTVPARSVVTLVGEIADSSTNHYGYDPNQYQLFQNYPNPFKQDTQLCYYLPDPGNVHISIYSLLGQKIFSTQKEEQFAGVHCIPWDGTNNNQEAVSSGIYLYSMRIDQFDQSKKMVFIQ